MKLLPEEPTEEMSQAWCANCHAWDLDAYKAMYQAAPEVEQEPVEPDVFSANDGDTWVESPSDWDCFDSWNKDEIVVGAEYELNVCWTGKQTYRITKIGDDGDVEEVELVSSTKQYFTHTQPKQQLELVEKEPVAYGLPNTAITGKQYLMDVKIDIPSDDQYGGAFWVPLYTHPQPKREPLSEESALKILSDIPHRPVPTMDIVRAIEKAHGIGSGV